MATKSNNESVFGKDQFPDDWREVSLSSVADIRFSGVDKLSRPSETPVRLCNYTDVYNNEFITDKLQFMQATATQSEIERFGLQAGDVIITKDSETPDDIGIPAVVDHAPPDLVCGYHLALIRPKRDEVDPTFLAKQLRHHRLARYFGQRANGLTRYALPTGVVANTPLRLPSLGEQKAIGETLRLLDNAIAQTQAVIAKLKQLRAGLLHDLLTMGLDEHGQLRDPIVHPEQFKDSSLGRIPNTWRIIQFREAVAEMTLGTTVRGMTKGKQTIPLLKMGNLHWGSLDLGEVEEVDADRIPGLDHLRLKRRDFLFNTRNTPGLVGKIAVWHEELSEATFDNNLLRIRFNPGIVSPFVCLWMSNGIGRNLVFTLATATTSVAAIYWSNLANYPLPVPSNEEQEAIVSFIETQDQVITKENSILRKLCLLKSGLMADLLTGRVRVPENIAEVIP